MKCVFKTSRDLSGPVRCDVSEAGSSLTMVGGELVTVFSRFFTGKAATVVHCDVCASADCPLTQEDQNMSCSVKVVRSLVAAMAL